MTNSDVIYPTPEQLQRLSAFERQAFRLVNFINTSPWAKQASHRYLRMIGACWVYYCSRNLTHVLGLENIERLNPHRGLLLASNHRSFFDQYFIACWLFRTTKLLKRLYFPVRAEFWYERPLGLGLSLLMSGLCMYPPMFREPNKRDFNKYSVQRLIQLLQRPGNVVGVHPEGTRNKGKDPYALLRAQPGIGQLILGARPTVIPLFINGLSNNFGQQVVSNFDGSGTPVVLVIGKPLSLDAFYEKPNKLRTQKEVADFVLAEIYKLGQIERDYRRGFDPQNSQGPRILRSFGHKEWPAVG
jgi:1-acyl-sn-glycerol-3-phosphate acyltransferase